jgi:hypothetical protein
VPFSRSLSDTLLSLEPLLRFGSSCVSRSFDRCFHFFLTWEGTTETHRAKLCWKHLALLLVDAAAFLPCIFIVITLFRLPRLYQRLSTVRNILLERFSFPLSKLLHIFTSLTLINVQGLSIYEDFKFFTTCWVQFFWLLFDILALFPFVAVLLTLYRVPRTFKQFHEVNRIDLRISWLNFRVRIFTTHLPKFAGRNFGGFLLILLLCSRLQLSW